MAQFKMSRRIRKQTICIGENKGADQLSSNCTADQCLCFRYTDSTIPLLPKSEISCSYPSSISAQASLCWTLSKTQIVGFLMHRLKCKPFYFLLRLNSCVLKNLKDKISHNGAHMSRIRRKTGFMYMRPGSDDAVILVTSMHSMKQHIHPFHN